MFEFWEFEPSLVCCENPLIYLYEGEEMVQLVRWLTHKHIDLSLICRTHGKGWMWWCVVAISFLGWQIGRSTGLTARPSPELVSPRFQSLSGAKIQGRQYSSGLYTDAYVHLHTYTHRHTRTYTFRHGLVILASLKIITYRRCFQSVGILQTHTLLEWCFQIWE